MDGQHWVVYYYVTIMIIEGTLLGLALWKAWQHRSSAHGSSLMQQLTKGSVLYFFLSVVTPSIQEYPLMSVFQHLLDLLREHDPLVL